MNMGLSEPRILATLPARPEDEAATSSSCELARHPLDAAQPRWRLALHWLNGPIRWEPAARRRRWIAVAQGGPLHVEHGEGESRLDRAGADLLLPDGPVALKPLRTAVLMLELSHVDGLTWQSKPISGLESFILGAQTDLLLHASTDCVLRCGEHSWPLSAGETLCTTLQDMVFLDIETVEGGHAQLLMIDRSALPGTAYDSSDTAAAATELPESPATPTDLPEAIEAVDPNQFPRPGRVRLAWTSPQPAAPMLPAGSVVIIGRAEPRLPGWCRFTTARGQQGLARSDRLAVDGLRATLLEDLPADWLSVAEGEAVDLLARDEPAYRVRLADGREGRVPIDSVDAPA